MFIINCLQIGTLECKKTSWCFEYHKPKIKKKIKLFKKILYNKLFYFIDLIVCFILPKAHGYEHNGESCFLFLFLVSFVNTRTCLQTWTRKLHYFFNDENIQYKQNDTR